MSIIVRDCPYCKKSARLTMPPPAWDGAKPCPACGGSLGVCTARGEPFFFHLFKMPEEGDAPHTCRAHAKQAELPRAA
ncbi:MAG TPA: hypothetical protein VED18_10975 [Candidatus Sulfotelmatobacter sp.]|nr:hypothetical protein [Candidatus Sulfotelmatobacter sp.]